MSKTAILSLLAMIICAMAYYLAPHASSAERVSGGALVVLAVLFGSAMFIGRRVRFDPRLD